MTDEANEPRTKSSARQRADEIKQFRCKNLIAVLECPTDVKNIGTVIRNVNALGVEKVYVVDPRVPLPTVIAPKPDVALAAGETGPESEG